MKLAYNKIIDINILAKVYFNDLIELDLENNQINDIDVFSKVRFKNY